MIGCRVLQRVGGGGGEGSLAGFQEDVGTAVR